MKKKGEITRKVRKRSMRGGKEKWEERKGKERASEKEPSFSPSNLTKALT